MSQTCNLLNANVRNFVQICKSEILETPFHVSHDPFRDWIEFSIKWNFDEDQWHRTQTTSKTQLLPVISSLLFDLGYYYDSYFKLTDRTKSGGRFSKIVEEIRISWK